MKSIFFIYFTMYVFTWFYVIRCCINPLIGLDFMVTSFCLLLFITGVFKND